jgi:diguanylate cyclase (GGDEF)-like protein/PAS domain S-box-containing protein
MPDAPRGPRRTLAVETALTRAILEAALDCIITIDHEGIVREWNPAAERTFGYRREDAVGREMAELIVPPEARDAHRQGMARYLATGEGPLLGRRIEVGAQRADGSIIQIELAINHVDIPGPPIFTAYLREITDRIAAERQLRDAEERYRTLVERLPAIVYVADFGSQGTWRYVSPQIEAVLGFTPAEWLADAGLWARQIHPVDRELVLAAEEQLRSHGVEESAIWEYRMLARDGAVVWIRDEAVMIPGDETRTPQMRGVMIDITDRKKLEERLTHQAFYDGLTGLPNRALFLERLDHALARAARRPTDIVAVLFLDLDGFKVVNDTLGHTAGDELLKAVSRRLVDGSRADDTAARLGGDEFTMLLEDVSGVDEVARYATRVLERISAPVDVEEHRLTVSASIGIAISGSGDMSAEDLLRQADVAMYRAKQNGKAGFEIYDERMSVEDGQLRVHYQPIFDLATGDIVEVEALARWQHPERGTIDPSGFIPFAESMGLITEIDRVVLESACRQVRAWGTTGIDRRGLTLGVNLSAREFRVPGIVATVAEILEVTGLPASQLKLEITESVILIESDLTESIIRGLSDLGVRIAIDDFGVGYSALGYLRRLSADTLKIDRSFVAGLGHSREDAAIVTATIALARALDMSVTAEGIETAAQARMLRELGCERGQGYLYSRPVPPDRLADMLLAGTARSTSGTVRRRPAESASPTGLASTP